MSFVLGLMVTMGCMWAVRRPRRPSDRALATMGICDHHGIGPRHIIVANPTKVILDTGKAIMQAVLDRA